MDQSWIVLALLCAVSLPTSDAFAKKVLRPENELAIAWLKIALSAPVLLAVLLLSPMPRPDATFGIAFALALPLEIAAAILYIKALRISPLSLTLPFQSLTPLFLILFSRLILGERVSGPAGLGIALIVLGGYSLHMTSTSAGILAPLRAAVRERGSLFMILVALIYSVTSSLGKVAVEHSSPAFFGAAYYLALTVCMLRLLSARSTRPFPGVVRENLRPALLPALFQAAMAITHYAAISRGKVAYVIAIKRTSLLIGSLYGFFLFHESRARTRFPAALLMFAGFVLIVLFP